MASAAEVAEKLDRDEIRSRWLLSAPALVIIMFAAVGPLLIVLVYSFLAPGDYGGVKWAFSGDGWFNVFLQRDIFDDTLTFADAHLTILWRSVKLSFLTTLLTFVFGFPTAYFIATRPERSRDVWLFLITIPFWTNLLIRTFAVQEVVRNEGVVNTALTWLGVINTPIQLMYTDTAILIGMLYVYLPLMVLPLYASLEKLDFSLVEAAYDLYATRFQVLRKRDPAAGQAGHHCRLDPGLHPVARRLCHAAGPGRRQEHDAGQSDRASIRPGPQLAARRRAGDDAARHRDDCAALLCRQVQSGSRRHG